MRLKILALKLILFAYFGGMNVFGFWLIKTEYESRFDADQQPPSGNIFIAAGMGAAVGVGAGMIQYNYKTDRLRYLVGIPVLILVNGAFMIYFNRRISAAPE